MTCTDVLGESSMHRNACALLVQIVQFFKEKKLSANLPYKVQFQIPQEDGAKPVKLVAHLVRPQHMLCHSPTHLCMVTGPSAMGNVRHLRLCGMTDIALCPGYRQRPRLKPYDQEGCIQGCG